MVMACCHVQGKEGFAWRHGGIRLDGSDLGGRLDRWLVVEVEKD